MGDDFHPDRADIAAGQIKQLRSLIAALIPANAFYRRKFSRLGKNLKFRSLEEFAEKIPFTTKSEIVADQLRHPPFGTNLTFPLERYTRCHQTSGTTATPLRWLDTPENWNWMVESWCEIFRAAGVGRGDRIYFPFSFGPFIGFWLAFEAGQKLGCLCLPAGGLSSEARLRAIVENEITVLCCTPTYALRLAEVAAKEKISLKSAKVKTLIVAGEPGGSIPTTRQRLEKLWPRAKIFDHHGMTETGPVTLQCPKHAGVLHVLENAYFAESVDREGNAVLPGETGELVLTTLGRIGSPLIRYRTGDLVKAANVQRSTLNIQRSKSKARRCACGRFDLALKGGILGRVDDMLIIRGVNIYPSAVEEILRGYEEIAEFQVQVCRANSLPELKLKIEPKPDCTAPQRLVESVQRALQMVFSLRIDVGLVGPGTLPRFEMKAKRWIEIKTADKRR